MRSIWKGAVSFGLVTIPVKLYGATEERDVKFNQVRRSDGSRIRYKRVAAADDTEVSYGDIAKGFELPSGEMVVLTDDDFNDLPLSTSRVIDVLEFVPLEQIDPVYFAKSYYLEPEKTGIKPYVLLRDALVSSGQVALVKVALRQRESLAALRVRNNVFVLETMLWPDEVREADFPFLAEDIEVRPQELQMAQSLIDTLAADFDPSQYSDSYRDALQALIDAKIEGHEVRVPAGSGEATGGAVLDLMAALRASVDAAKSNRGGRAPAQSPAKAADEPVEAADGPVAAADAPVRVSDAPVALADATAGKAPTKTSATRAPAKTPATASRAKTSNTRPAPKQSGPTSTSTSTPTPTSTPTSAAPVRPARARSAPVEAGPSKPVQAKASPVEAGPAKPVSAKASPAKAGPAKPVSAKASPAKAGPAKTTPVKTPARRSA